MVRVDGRYAEERPPLAYCRIDGHYVAARKPPRSGTVDLGNGITVRNGERRTAKPRGFHIIYRSWQRFDLYGDGTVDAHIYDGNVDTGTVRYHILKSEMDALAATMRRLDIRHQPEARQTIPDSYVDNADATMDGWRVRNRHLTPEMTKAIRQATRMNEVISSLPLRARLLEANGFRFDSATGADFALSMTLRSGPNDADLKDFLRTYRVPCVGGMYGVYAIPLIETPRRWRLRDALIEGKHPAIADLVDPGPDFPPPPEPESLPPSPGPMPSGNWAVFPDQKTQLSYYPPNALDDEIEGRAKVDCVIMANGRVSNCQIISEAPPGLGFGKATVKIMTREAKARPGRFTAGQRILVTYKWILPD